MTQREYINHRIKTFSKISATKGYSLLHLCFTYAVSKVFHGADFSEYCSFQMYRLNNRARRDYMTTGRCRRLLKTLNRHATEEDSYAMSRKSNFNKNYSSFIHRDWLYIPESTEEDIRAFVARNPKFLVKTSYGTWGEDIHLYDNTSLDMENFLSEYTGKPYLLEAFIRQHPVMAEPNPSSVNTVRMMTAKIGDQVLLVGAGLRVGGAGQFVDNYNHGGVAYPIDLETGIISGPGLDYDGLKKFLFHPGTGCQMTGLRIPNWELVKSEARRAALVSEHIGYVGWDIAVTEGGVDFIEGNVRLPGSCVIQLAGFGVYPKIKQFIRKNRHAL